MQPGMFPGPTAGFVLVAPSGIIAYETVVGLVVVFVKFIKINTAAAPSKSQRIVLSSFTGFDCSSSVDW